MSQGFAQQLSAATLRAAQQGQKAAQTEIFETYRHAVLTTLLGMCRQSALAHDLGQDVFLQAMQKLTQVREPKAFGGWLKQLTVTTALQHFRKRSPLVLVEALPEEPEVTWMEDADWLENVENIGTLFAQLDEYDRAIVWLYCVEDYTHKAIAEHLQLKPAAVRQRYRRALDKLRKEVQARGTNQ